MPDVREYQEADWPSLWRILNQTILAADAYAFAPGTSEEFMHRYWIENTDCCYVATDDAGEVVGSHYIKPNQPGLGSHVCNAGYVVDPSARGKGLGRLLCEHSQRIAIEKGYRSMQFNFVVSTNTGAVELWKKLGFDIVGTLPEAYHHGDGRYVDAFVMFKRLDQR